MISICYKILKQSIGLLVLNQRAPPFSDDLTTMGSPYFQFKYLALLTYLHNNIISAYSIE